MYFVYILKSMQSGFFYTGLTDNLERRLNQHNSNWNQSTKNRGPWLLIHKEVFENRKDARAREKFLKSGIGREFRATLDPKC